MIVSKDLRNIAFGKRVTSSDVRYGGPPEKAVDNKWNNGIYERDGACSHTGNKRSWIRVDLGKSYAIAGLNVVGRRSSINNLYQSKNWIIRIGNDTNENSGTICSSEVDANGGYLVPVYCKTKLSGRYVTISSNTTIVLCEIQVLIKDGNSIDSKYKIDISFNNTNNCIIIYRYIAEASQFVINISYFVAIFRRK